MKSILSSYSNKCAIQQFIVSHYLFSKIHDLNFDPSSVQLGWVRNPLFLRDKNMKIVRKLFLDDKGATAIEYGLIAALIAVAAVGAMSGLGEQIGKTMNNSSTTMSKG